MYKKSAINCLAIYLAYGYACFCIIFLQTPIICKKIGKNICGVKNHLRAQQYHYNINNYTGVAFKLL